MKIFLTITHLLVLCLAIIARIGKHWGQGAVVLREKLLDIARKNADIEDSVHILCSAPVLRYLLPTNSPQFPQLHLSEEDANLSHQFDLLYSWNHLKELWKTYYTYKAEALAWNAASEAQPFICRQEALLLSNENLESYHTQFRAFLFDIMLYFVCCITLAIVFILYVLINKLPFNITITNCSKTISTSDIPPPLSSSVPVILNNKCERTAKIFGHPIALQFDSGSYNSVMPLDIAQDLDLDKVMSGHRKQKVNLFYGIETVDLWDLPPIDVQLDKRTNIKVRFVVQKGPIDIVIIGAPEIERYQASFRFNREEEIVSLYLNKNNVRSGPDRRLYYHLKGRTEGDTIYKLKNIFIDTGAIATTMNELLYDTIDENSDDFFPLEYKYPSFFNGQVNDNSLQTASLGGTSMVLGTELFLKYNCTIDFGKKEIYFQLDESKSIKADLLVSYG